MMTTLWGSIALLLGVVAILFAARAPAWGVSVALISGFFA